MQNWEIKTLQEVCIMKITDGTHQTPKYCEKEDGGYPLISSKNVTKEYIDWSDIKYIIPELHETLYKRIAPQKDDVLLAKNGTTGVAAIVDDDRIFDIYVTLAILRPNTKIIYPQYLLKIINSPICKVQFNTHLKGSGVPNLHLEEIQKVTIPLPPLEEQKRIVKILDEKFAMLETVKANAKANLQNAKDLFQSQLTKAFSNTTWEKKRLGDCGSFKNGMNFASTDTGYTIRSLGVGDFKNLYQIDDTEQLSEISLKAAPSEDYLLKDGDIVFVRSNGNKELVGRCLLVYPKNIPTTYSGFCIRFRKDYDELDADFLLHYMKAESSRKILNGKEGANISNLNQKILGDFEVPLPPLSEQKRIVEQLDSLSEKVRSLEEIYTKQLANCDELKQAFLAKAFNGKL